MSEAPHTPGPWSVGPYFDNDGSLELIIERKTQHGNMVVAVALPGLFGQEKNAHLIASAPSLLEILEGVLMMDRDKEGRIIIHGWQEDVIRAEVAKAKGQP